MTYEFVNRTVGVSPHNSRTRLALPAWPNCSFCDSLPSYWSTPKSCPEESEWDQWGEFRHKSHKRADEQVSGQIDGHLVSNGWFNPNLSKLWPMSNAHWASTEWGCLLDSVYGFQLSRSLFRTILNHSSRESPKPQFQLQSSCVWSALWSVDVHSIANFSHFLTVRLTFYREYSW